MTKLLATLIVLFISLNLYAQEDVEALKRNPDIFWGEGYGVTLGEAIDDAKAHLVRSIKSIILETIERNSSEQGIIIERKTTSLSNFSLGDKVHTLLLRDEPDAKVFAWIEKEQVKEIQKARKALIEDYFNVGCCAEKNLQIDDALRNYYWAFVLCVAEAEPVIMEVDGKENNMAAYLRQKINSVLSHIKVTCASAEQRHGRYYIPVRFTYADREISSIQYKYFDGQALTCSYQTKGCEDELELVQQPLNHKVKVYIEYQFVDYAKSQGCDEVRLAFNFVKEMEKTSAIPIQNSSFELSLNTTSSLSEVPTNFTDSIKPILPPQKRMKRIETISDPTPYKSTLQLVEQAITRNVPTIAQAVFSEEGYTMFAKLFKECNQITLAQPVQTYQFIQANGYVVARFCKVKIKQANGMTFAENLAFRFNPLTAKIESFAFGLTPKAESDIFNAAAQWPDVSRFAIQMFMEDYQTAYFLKREDYISMIYSEDAIIISGTVLKKQNKPYNEGMTVELNNSKDIEYKKFTKKQYMANLRRLFRGNNYIHLTFEDNQTKVINEKHLPKGTAFGIQIRQSYYSPGYSDKGYLTLILDASRELPVIHVRLWQPDLKDFVELDHLINLVFNENNG